MNEECNLLVEELTELLLSKNDVYQATKDLEWVISDATAKAIDKTYVKVELVNGSPTQVRRDIEKNYGYHTTWTGYNDHCCGTITVYVPKNECTKKLLKCFKVYDALLGATFEGADPREYPTVD